MNFMFYALLMIVVSAHSTSIVVVFPRYLPVSYTLPRQNAKEQNSISGNLLVGFIFSYMHSSQSVAVSELTVSPSLSCSLSFPCKYINNINQLFSNAYNC